MMPQNHRRIQGEIKPAGLFTAGRMGKDFAEHNTRESRKEKPADLSRGVRAHSTRNQMGRSLWDATGF